jgi:hypothetical protein
LRFNNVYAIILLSIIVVIDIEHNRIALIRFHRGTQMTKKVQTAIKGTAVLLAMFIATGCTGVQNQVDALETRVGQLEQQVSADNSNSGSALQAAEAAQITADEALVVAAEGIACCDATNEKIDRMFQRSQSK